jgi:hypothetical protein
MSGDVQPAEATSVPSSARSTTVEHASSRPAVPPTAKHAGRRRRPSGAPPPLPRSLGTTGKGWLALMLAVVVVLVLARWSASVRRLIEQVDTAILRAIAEIRVSWLTDLFRAVDRIGLGWSFTVLALALIVTLLVFRRWRHLFTYLGGVFLIQLVGVALIEGFQRTKPYDVTILDRWKGFSMPSAPVAVVTMLVVGYLYTLVVAGRARSQAKIVGAVLVAVYCFARLYLAVDHPTDALVSVVLTVGILVNAFRFFTPNEVFPVTYQKGKTAHLDVTGERGEAIRHAIRDQLGLTVVEIKPVGLAGSGGSTPLRLRVEGDPDTYLFGKLYAMNHVRADRWYKLGRTILYGRLEDEKPFQSVRRLVQYEDYALRMVRDSGIHTATAYGIVEMTPEREYLLVTEFFYGAVEIGEATVDDDIIDQGLLIVRRLWDAGLAHRDIKPANLLVRDGELLVIDVAFVQVRPSPWRQAIDLANMMLVMAVRTDAPRVYDRAVRLFTPDEIAEAFAATRGVASPTQLRVMMKRDGRDLVTEFRKLAPPRRPVSLQRWSVKRVLLAAGVLIGTLLALAATFNLFTPAELEGNGTPSCGTDNVMVLMAQSVPTATSLPCLAALPAGWELGGLAVKRGESRFWLDSDLAGQGAVTVTLLPPSGCRTDEAVEVLSDEPDMQRFEQPERLPPELRTTRYYTFAGGCVTYEFDFGAEADTDLLFAADSALAFQARRPLVEAVADRTDGLILCGAEAPPCTGGR